MNYRPVIVWFRNDLRIEDNPALFYARETGAPVIAVYILDDRLAWAPGAASRWQLHHSLKSLAQDLESTGTKLILRRSDSQKAILALAEETGARGVFFNRRYYGKHIAIDDAVTAELEGAGVKVETFNGLLLREPWELKTGAGGPYRVFTPFWRSLRAMGPARQSPLPRLRRIKGPKRFPKSDRLEDWAFLPEKPDWAKEFADVWRPGENSARKRLNAFLQESIANYADERDRLDKEHVSRLSPCLALGVIGPLQIWSAVRKAVSEAQAEKFLSEVAWREFCYNLLYYNADLPEAPLRKEFADYPWRNDRKELTAWRKGLTGYPVVDAGMRQLWRTGWMHNRARMIAASFLVKDLQIPWQQGKAWFWDTLVDADLANNAANWQWVAGCGADAAPYFRIFNPIAQGEKFDQEGDYVREFVPELADLPAKFIHAPWTAPQAALENAGVTLGKSYPFPIINHKEARQRALAGYAEIKRV